MRWSALLIILSASFLAALGCTLRNVDVQPTSSSVRPLTRMCKAPYGPSEQSGFGSPKGLRGLTKIFVDAIFVEPRGQATEEFKVLAAAATAEHRNQIISTINDANLGLILVTRPEEAEAILAFCTNSNRSTCDFSTGPGDFSDSGFGEVYTVQPVGLRLVMLYNERCTLRSRQLGKAFAEAFVQAYRTTIK